MATHQDSRDDGMLGRMIRNAERIENELVQLAQLIQDPRYQQGIKRCPSTIGLLRNLVSILETTASGVVSKQQFGTRRCRPDLPPLKIPSAHAHRVGHQPVAAAAADWCDRQYGEDLANRIELIKHYISRLATAIESNQQSMRLFQNYNRVETLIIFVERIGRETLFVRDHLLAVTSDW